MILARKGSESAAAKGGMMAAGAKTGSMQAAGTGVKAGSGSSLSGAMGGAAKVLQRVLHPEQQRQEEPPLQELLPVE